MTFSVTNQNVVVIGAGRSGQAAAELLSTRGAHVTLADSNPARPTDTDRLERRGIAVEYGHREGLLTSADLIVLSPGVPLSQEAIAAARRHGVPVIGEIELASRWIQGRIVAITGTKGKSTTTTLTARMLQQAGFSATAGGNLGVALSSQVTGSTAETLHVVEVSSFQLETTDTFHPWIAVLVNLSPDHLDRHATFEEYAGAKARIFTNQSDEDWAVINADDPVSLALAKTGRARRVDFGFDATMADGVTIDGAHIVERRGGVTRPLVPLAAVKLPGRHLLADVMAAAAVGVVAGVPSSAMTRAVEEFEGLEHALERVVEVSGVRFVNDSKATNVVSAMRAIESFERGVVPILGGRYKGGAFEDLQDVIRARADGVVAIGESADLVVDALAGVVPVVRAGSMEDAVRRAFAMASPGGVVLLAPACSSFDMFADYAERGRAFKAAARALVAEVQATRQV